MEEFAATKYFSVNYPTRGAAILAGRQTVKGSGAPGTHVDVLLRLNGMHGSQVKMEVDPYGKWQIDYLMTSGAYVLKGWSNKELIPFPFTEGIAPPPDVIVEFVVWEVRGAYTSIGSPR